MGKLNLTWAERLFLHELQTKLGYGVGLHNTDKEIAEWIEANRTYEGTLDEAVALLKQPLLKALNELRNAPKKKQIEMYEHTLERLRLQLLFTYGLMEYFSGKDEHNRTAAQEMGRESIPPLERGLDLLQKFIEELKGRPGKPKRRKQRAATKPPLGWNDFLLVSSAGPYQFVQETVAEGLNGMNKPTLEKHFFHRRRKTLGLDAELQVRPEEGQLPVYPNPEELQQWVEMMTLQYQRMNDETVDCLDVIAAKWLDQAQHPEEGINLSVNELLQARGLKCKKGGGYPQETRKRMAHQVETLGVLWLKIYEAPRWETVTDNRGKKKRVERTDSLESRLLDISIRKTSTLRGWDAAGGDVQYFSWRLKPGLALLPWVAGENKQLALLSTKALAYDPYRQKPEKRLLRYLSWQWRIRRYEGNLLQPFTIRTLLENIHLRKDVNNPVKTKDRLEKALETLLEDKLINAWQYDGWDESLWTSNGWNGWTDARVIIEPPQTILDRTAKFPAPPQKKLAAATKGKPGEDLPRLLKDARLARGLTQLQAVEQVQDLLKAQGDKQSISQGFYSTIETGKRNPGPALRRVLLEWAKR